MRYTCGMKRTRSIALLITLILALSAATPPDRIVTSWAVQAVIWGMPAVNFELMYDAMVGIKGDFNQIVYWSRPPQWRNQTLTPNPDTIYLMPFINTASAGPMVLEIPPARGGSIVGTIMDAWQCALEDVGPAGADKGKGGKYLILPPGYSGSIPPGYIVLRSDTNAGYALLRSNLKSHSDADIATSVAYGKRIRLYPLSRATNPAQTTFIDASTVLYDSAIPYDARYFAALSRFIARESWLARDRVMIEQLQSIGIAKGKTFDPDAHMLALLGDAATQAHDYIESLYEAGFATPFYPGTHWGLPVSQIVLTGQSNLYADPNAYPLDGRAVYFSIAFFSTKHLGQGQFYLLSIRSKSGQFFDGAQNYRLHVPANVPVTLYWSVTAYNRATHTLIRDVPWASRASNSGVQKNDDGSVDVYFGPTAPPGKQSNWVPTKAGQSWEALFRAYGPTKAFFDKAWQLPDITLAQ
jgi:hypothetical protein